MTSDERLAAGAAGAGALAVGVTVVSRALGAFGRGAAAVDLDLGLVGFLAVESAMVMILR